MEHCIDHSAHIERLDRDDARLDGDERKLDEHSNTLIEISTTLRQVVELNHKMDDRISTLEQVPARRWDVLVECIVSGVVGAAMMALMQMLVR